MAETDFHAMVSAAYEQAETGAAPDAVEADGGAGNGGSPVASDPGISPEFSADGGDSAAPMAPPSRKDGRDENGRFAPKAKDPAAPAVKTKAPKEVAGAPSSTGSTPPPSGGDSSPAEPAAPVAEAVRPPQSLNPAEREVFAKAPPEIQRALQRIDQTARQALSESAPARKFQQEFAQATHAYQPMLQRAGLNPIQAVQSAFNTIDQLQSGTPQSRAQVFHALMQAYPTDLEALAVQIERGPQAQPQGQQPPLNEEALMQKWEQRQEQKRLQASSARQEQEIQRFAEDPGNEFFGDVGHEMLAMLQAAKARRVELSLKDAYDRACRANPEVWDIVQKRSRAEAAKATTASTQQARLAASSVKSTPSTGASQVRPPRNHREMVEAAWDALDR